MKNWVKVSDFFNQSDVNVVKNTTATEIMYEHVRNKLFLKVTGVFNYVGDVGAWTNITWKLRCNGIPIDPFTAQKSPIGQQGVPQKVIVDFIFPPASRLSWTADNADGINNHVVGIMTEGEYGYFE